MAAVFSYMGVLNSIRRDPQTVARGLRSFFQQNPAPQKVLFIDQNDRKIELPADLKNNPALIHLHAPVPSVGMARNLVPQNAEADWLIFCDDDGFLAEDYVTNLANILRSEPELELVCGPYVNETDGKYYSIRSGIECRLNSLMGSKRLLGSNISIRAKTFDRIGRYDTRFGPGSGWPSSDETDLCWKAIQANVPMKFTTELRVFHPPAHVEHLPTAMTKAYRYGLGKGALSAKWMFERPSVLGYWEFVEMTGIPFVNVLRGILRGDFRQIPMQAVTLSGRFRGFFQFVTRALVKAESAAPKKIETPVFLKAAGEEAGAHMRATPQSPKR